jgi:hypothetical protein
MGGWDRAFERPAADPIPPSRDPALTDNRTDNSMLISYDTRLFLDCRTPPVHRHYDLTMTLCASQLMPGYPPRHVRDAMARSIGRAPAVYKGRLFRRCVRGAARCVRGRCPVRVFAHLALSEIGVRSASRTYVGRSRRTLQNRRGRSLGATSHRSPRGRPRHGSSTAHGATVEKFEGF